MEHSLKSQPVDNQQAVDNQLVNNQNLMQVFEKLDNRLFCIKRSCRDDGTITRKVYYRKNKDSKQYA